MPGLMQSVENRKQPESGNTIRFFTDCNSTNQLCRLTVRQAAVNTLTADWFLQNQLKNANRRAVLKYW